MLALGTFIGLIATLVLPFINGIGDWQGVLASIIGACFGGLVATFITNQSQRAPDAVFMYPVGLMLGYSWQQTPALAKMLQDPSGWMVFLGVVGLLGNIILTLFAVVLGAYSLLVTVRKSKS